MKKYKYVVAAGCSFTLDPPYNNELLHLPKDGKSYGRLISEYFGSKYYELADNGLSLQGMHRRTLEWCSKNKDKFKDTLIIVGMTGLSRVEIWNNKWYGDHHSGFPWMSNSQFFQSTDPGAPNSKWKVSPWKKDWPEVERKNYFINFYNENAVFFLAIQSIIGLQSFLKLNNIDHIFFDALEPIDTYWEKFCDDKEDKLGHKLLFDNLVLRENWYKHPQYESLTDFTTKNIDMRISKDDNHPNKKAHKYWSECLLEYMRELSI